MEMEQEDMFLDIHYDYIIHNNMYYFHYSDTITRMNINTKKEELFQLILKPTDNGWYTNRYEWVSYSDYYESR